jgi:hypothetical protein
MVRQARGQGRQRSEPGGLEKEIWEKPGAQKNTLVDLTKQDELATDKQRKQV